MTNRAGGTTGGTPPVPSVDLRSSTEGGYLGFGRPPAPTDRASIVFAALADPTRRALVRELTWREELTATQIAQTYPMTRQAIVKHLTVLGDAGIVTSRRAGREQRYRLVPEAIEPAIAWMADVGAAWDERLAALKKQIRRRP
jgi:DNA-binding transcriptional ArsR family regulator